MDVELLEICETIADIDHKMPKAVLKGVPFLSAKDVTQYGTLNFEKIKYISQKDFLRLSRKICPQKGDIIYTRIGTIGRCAIVRDDTIFLVSYSCCVIRPKKSEVDSSYLSYYLSSEYALRQATHGVKGIGVPDLGMKQIREFKIPLLPLDQQKQIASILDTADAYRQKTKTLIEKYDALTQSLFLDMFGDPVTNPKGWEIDQLLNLTTKIGSGSTPRGGKEAYQEEGISLIRSLNVYDNRFKYENLAHINDKQAEKLKHVTVEENDVLFNITGASICRSTVVPIDVLPARVNQHVSILRADKRLLNSLFLNHYLISENVKNSLLGVGSGGGAVMQAITKKQLTELEVITPPISLQNQFAERVKAIETQKTLAQQELDKANELFNSLLQKAFKGGLV